MLMADNNNNIWSHQLTDDVAACDDDNDDDDHLTIDLKDFWDILDEKEPIKNCTEDLSAVKVQEVGLSVPERATSYNSDASDPGNGTSDFSSECVGNHFMFDHQNLEPSTQTVSPASFPGSLSNLMLPASGIGAGDNSFFHCFPSHGVDYHDQSPHRVLNYVPSFGFVPEDISLDALMEKPDLNHVADFDSSEYTARITDISETADMSFMDIGMSTTWDSPAGYTTQFLPNNVDVSNLMDGIGVLSTQTAATLHGNEMFETHEAKLGDLTMGAALTEDSNSSRLNMKWKDHISTSSIKQSPAKLANLPKPMPPLLPRTFADMSKNKNVISVKNEGGDNLVPKVIKKLFKDTDKKSRASKSLRQLFPPVLFSNSGKDFSVRAKEEKEEVSLVTKRAHQSFDRIMESENRRLNQVTSDHCTDIEILEQPFYQPFASLKRLQSKTNEIVGEMTKPQCVDSHFSRVSGQTSRTTAIVNSFQIDDDPDVCILEDRSGPVRSNLPLVNRKPLASSQHLTISDPLNHVGLGGVKLKENDERIVLRVALQDLSQPKTEASPPDGVLAVPLLRHQRIALSWMVQKETASLHCSGGILADDQGLGKTISTIALILKERSPTSSVCMEKFKQKERETYNLDEEDDCTSVLSAHEHDTESCQESTNGSLMSQTPAVLAKGRPRAGTLVVCPTSVLRQWADELHTKVTNSAKLSVLVYHGSSRTKDPYELARYDVVITTYSIVSMEVPKQPLDDKDDDETGRDDSHAIPSMGLSPWKKRKYPPTSKKSSKKVKESDSLLLESSARPLARVGWFRVVLDEAQSIKNHRTQVARACWGLRAKRRWCLSGTPIQNSVDDLYSYFRFLRYDPYATYKSFCSSIKLPISRNSTTGYKKLQAVLKTVMLRRTKGTLLDGEPIINLPPKSIELKKVDFTMEERDFYCNLEADSRAQFAEYAAAGTVKQNYVNILLMLLRLRQACDHPLLVKSYNSSSAWKSSVEMAKNLPREKQVNLLSCLEASLAICALCNDPPEDAVVTSCGHVFCNQCICEHLTGDDKQCPSTNCKDRLSASSIFSRASLRCSLSQDLGKVGIPDSSGSEVCDKLENSSWGPPFVSSKIKAALKVLESISKPKHSTDDDVTLPKKSPDPFVMEEESNTDIKIDGDRDTDLVAAPKELVRVAREKAIVFSQWTRMLDLLESGLKSSSIQYRRLDGTMTVLARDKAVKDFKTLPEVTVIIMSLKAASLGLNMVAACHVILLDLWWNPTTEDQAVDRAHRIGQTRPVSVLRLTVKDTVEDRILALQQKKREMVASAFGEDETGSNQTRLTVEDLKYLFMA